ncbi:MAG: hypothetical protein HYU39_07020 [Thaumarchaeota archaeon]|nr:hypothetical protein [Nitrososphaerota archaeon]
MSSQTSETPPEDKRRNIKKRVNLLIAGLPFLIASLTLGGTLAGLYLQNILKRADFIIPIVTSLLGLGVSIYLSCIVANRVTSKPVKESRKR